MNDPDPYVKKTAIIGVIKIFYVNPQFVNDNLIDDLYNLIKDSNTLVVVSAINALNEVMASEGGMAINDRIIIYLINRITDFDEYGQSVILSLVARY
jgi:AP-4 complex subunit beta-1